MPVHVRANRHDLFLTISADEVRWLRDKESSPNKGRFVYRARVACQQHVERRVTTYQSRLFEDQVPAATRRFAEEGIGVFRWTDAVAGDRPEIGHRERSLEVMRRQMLGETAPDTALFIGGMEGIRDEHRLFKELRPERRWYALGRPGGAATALASQAPVAGPLREALRGDGTYPTLARKVLADLRAS
jgi:hypothetical protein